MPFIFSFELSRIYHSTRKITSCQVNPAHDLRPHFVDLWNRFKGGQDVVSRQMSNVKVNFRQLSPRAFLVIRQIMTPLLNAHLALRLVKLRLDDSVLCDMKTTMQNARSIFVVSPLGEIEPHVGRSIIPVKQLKRLTDNVAIFTLDELIIAIRSYK